MTTRWFGECFIKKKKKPWKKKSNAFSGVYLDELHYNASSARVLYSLSATVRSVGAVMDERAPSTSNPQATSPMHVC